MCNETVIERKGKNALRGRSVEERQRETENKSQKSISSWAPPHHSNLFIKGFPFYTITGGGL